MRDGDDGAELSSTQAQPEPQKSTEPKLTVHENKLSRRHRVCIKNTTIRNTVNKDEVVLSWFNIPYKDQRYYWTPKDKAKVMALGDLTKCTNINFQCHGFQAQFEVQYTTTGNMKVDAKPTHDPLLWTYIDSELCTAANIPLHKSHNPLMREFLQSRVVNGGAIPKCSQLRDYYLFDVYQTETANLKENIKNKKVALIVDELSDDEGRYVLDVMAVLLDFDELSPNGNSVAYLLDTHFLNATNNTPISRSAILDCVPHQNEAGRASRSTHLLCQYGGRIVIYSMVEISQGCSVFRCNFHREMA